LNVSTDASQFCLSEAKSDTGFNGFSATSSLMTYKCAFNIFF
jgi:hypothetical protein